MGVITRCCTRESIISNSQISLYSNSDSENKIQTANELSSSFDKNSAFQFITSDKLYALLTKNISKNSIVKQLSKDMTISEIISLMTELLKYIENFEPNEDNKIKINNIKINAKCSFVYSLKEMQKQIYEEKNNYFITKSLVNLCLIVQSLLLLKNEDSFRDDIYKINIWKNKDIVKETRKYGFQGAFFILLYKNRKINLNEGNKDKIKNDLLQEINQYYKLSTNFCNDLILT